MMLHAGRVFYVIAYLQAHRGAIVEAAQSHDLGKNRTWWRRAELA